MTACIPSRLPCATPVVTSCLNSCASFSSCCFIIHHPTGSCNNVPTPTLPLEFIKRELLQIWYRATLKKLRDSKHRYRDSSIHSLQVLDLLLGICMCVWLAEVMCCQEMLSSRRAQHLLGSWKQFSWSGVPERQPPHISTAITPTSSPWLMMQSESLCSIREVVWEEGDVTKLNQRSSTMF